MTESKQPQAEKPARVKGLRLTLGGAPDVPHSIAGVPGLFRPTAPTPVGGPGELDEAYAKTLHDDETIPLDLVDIPAGKTDEIRELAEQDKQDARQGLLHNARALRGEEQDRAREQAASIGD